MSAQLLDGQAEAERRRQRLAEVLADRVAKGQSPPQLAVILVGDDPASHIYVKHKQAACERVGIRTCCYRLSANVDQATVRQQLAACNADVNTHGVLLQLPLPAGLDAGELQLMIHPDKDVDESSIAKIGRAHV